MRVVLDTNVLVSALLSPAGPPAAIVNASLDGTLAVLIDNRILFEYDDVLGRTKFRFDPRDARAFLEFFRREGEYVSATASPVTTKDPADLPFLEVAWAAKADYLIAGNTKHYPDRDWIVSARHFLRILYERE